LIAADALHTVLGIPLGWDIAAFAAVGYPDEEPAAPRRKAPADVTRWIL
jgi:nitroreductase